MKKWLHGDSFSSVSFREESFYTKTPCSKRHTFNKCSLELASVSLDKKATRQGDELFTEQKSVKNAGKRLYFSIHVPGYDPLDH